MNKKRKGYTNRTLDKLWSKKVKELAGNKCEFCGSKEKLNAHHIQPRRLYSVRWNVDNGICLCENCHTKNIYSAHKNPAWFYYMMVDRRGEGWLKVLVDYTVHFDWKNNLKSIKESLK